MNTHPFNRSINHKHGALWGEAWKEKGPRRPNQSSTDGKGKGQIIFILMLLNPFSALEKEDWV